MAPWTVIIRQLCIKSQRSNKKRHKYITAIQVTPPNNNNNNTNNMNDNNKHISLSDTDPIDAQHIRHLHHIQQRIPIAPSGQLTIPLQKRIHSVVIYRTMQVQIML